MNNGTMTETAILKAFGYTQTSHKAKFDGYTPDGRTVQVKSVNNGNYPSISYKFFDENEPENYELAKQNFCEGLDILILVKTHTEQGQDSPVIDDYKVFENAEILPVINRLAKPMYQGKKACNPKPQMRLMLSKKVWATL